MNLNIKTKNLTLSTDVRDYLEKKLEALKKVMGKKVKDDDNVLIHIELAKTTKHHKSGGIYKAEANVRIDGRSYNAIAEEEDIKAAIDIMKDELLREIKTGKDKLLTQMKKGGIKAKNSILNSKTVEE